MNYQIPKGESFLIDEALECDLEPPYLNVSSSRLYRSQKNLTYPINVGRNIARDAALTHFIFPSDIELYPSPYLVKNFLEMIEKNHEELSNSLSPRYCTTYTDNIKSFVSRIKFNFNSTVFMFCRYLK